VGSSSESSGEADDDCILALQRLKDEASASGSAASSSGGSADGLGAVVVDYHHMRNLNPLGRHSVHSSGLTLPSSLTRPVLDDDIIVRQWILDLNQAKAVRERTSFVQVRIFWVVYENISAFALCVLLFCQ